MGSWPDTGTDVSQLEIKLRLQTLGPNLESCSKGKRNWFWLKPPSRTTWQSSQQVHQRDGRSTQLCNPFVGLVQLSYLSQQSNT